MDQKQKVNTVLGVLAILFFGAAIYLTMKEKPKTVPTPATPTLSQDDNDSNAVASNPPTESELNPPADGGGNTYSPGSVVYTPLSPEDPDVARESLIQYFNFLSEKKYNLAVAYHGSGWDVLRFWNRSVSADDYITLLKAGCEENGWHCLKIKNIGEVTQLTPYKYKFAVSFDNSINGKNSFDYYVEKVGTRFWVLSMPVI
jgi:hypothetical protein